MTASNRPVYFLAFLGDSLIASVPEHKGIDAAVKAAQQELDYLSATFEKEDIAVYRAWLSHEDVEGENCLYSGSDHGWLPDGFDYAYKADES